MSSLNLPAGSLSGDVLREFANNTPGADRLDFNRMIMQVPLGIAILFGPQFIVETANDKYLALIGRAREEFIGHPLFETVPELKGQEVERLLNNVLATGIPYYGNELKVFLVRNGRKQAAWFDFVYQPLKNDSGAIIGIMVVAYEVTGSVHAKHLLIESEKHFRNLVMQSPIAMTIFRGPDLVIDIPNETILKNIWKRKLEEVQGKKLLEVFPELAGQPFPQLMQRVFETGKVYRENEAPAFVKSASGEMEKFYLDFEYAPLFEPDGKSVSAIIVTVLDVTEKVNARKKVEESRESLKLAIESAELGTWDYDPVSNTLIWDDRTKKIFGLPAGEPVTYERFLGVTYDGDRDRVSEAVLKATSSGSSGEYNIEYRIYRISDHNLRWIRAKGKAFFNEDQLLERFLGTVYDFTDQRLSTQKLEDAESRLRLATEGTGIATWDLDLKTFSIIYSPRLAELFGRPNTRNITHAELRAQIHPYDRSTIVEKAFDKAIKTGLYYYEARVVWPDNSVHWLRTNGKVLFNEQKEPLRMLGTMLDITAEKQALFALQQSEIRYRHLVHSLPIAFYTCDIEGRIGIYNEAALELWGRSPAENDRWCGSYKIFGADGKSLAQGECPMALTLKTGHVTRGVEIIIERPDGTRVNVLPHPQPVYDEKGDMVGGINMLVDISDRKIAEKNTARLAAIIESSDDAIVSKTLEGIITSWNPGAEKLFGYSPEEMIGEPVSKLIPADRMEEETHILARLKKGERINHFDTIRMSKNGKLIDISLTISPIKDRQGNLIGASKIARDITIQKNLYNTLQDREQRLQMVLQAARLGIWEYSVTKNEGKYSPRCLEILGFGKNEHPTDIQIIDRLHPDDQILREQAMDKARQSGVIDVELRFIYPDITIHWVKVQGKIFYDNDLHPDRMLGTVMDITPQKNAFDALQESELLFKTIANVAPVGLWMTDRQANNNFVNNTWIEWTGVPLEQQFKGGWMSRVVPEDAARVRSNFMRSMARLDTFSDEFRVYRTDGKIRWCLTEGYPYYNNLGEFEGYAGSVTDITEKKMIQDELEKKVQERTAELYLANSALEKSNEELEQFAYVASHDLQEPLRKIKTFVGRLQESINENSGAPAGLYMEKIVAAAGRMSDLIRDLLEYSRTAKVSEKPLPTDLNAVLEDVKNDFELLIQQKKVMIHAERLPVLHAITHQMNQLFTNLLGNSLKFTRDERPPVITITASPAATDLVISHGLDPEKAFVEIIFSDNGIGFSNEFSERIFEIFQRLNPRSTYSGSGIGLSICRKIVVNHGGVIFANSVEGESSSFHILLPVNKERQER